MEAKILSAVKTEFPPCCLQIYEEEYIIVGTYELDKDTGYRFGSVDVFDSKLKLLHSYRTYGAVLDLKLSPFDDTLVATAHSTGNVELWRIVRDDGVSLERVSNLQVFDPETLIASLHFSPLSPATLLLTATTGETSTIDIEYGDIGFSTDNVYKAYQKQEKIEIKVQGEPQWALECESQVFDEQHSLQCWTAEFGKIHPLENVVFTGGDDATIMAHDLRSKELIWSNSRIHDAGVVAIKTSSPTFRYDQPTSLITGAYDDHIRTFDLRMLEDDIYPGRNIPVQNSHQLNLGGGVWRFSEKPREDNLPTNELLVCCLYDGAKIVKIDDSTEDYFSVTNYLKKGHESMCYGGQWGKKFIATCSFYDKSLQTWVKDTN